MKRALVAIAILFALAGIAATVTTATSNAGNRQVVNGVCGAGESCAYRNTYATGPIADFNTCEPNWSCGVSDFRSWDYYGWGGLTIDNSIGSIWNRVTRYSYTNYSENTFSGGWDMCVYKGRYSPSLSYFNDKLSSMWNANYCA